MSEAKEYRIEKRGNEWCAVSEDGSRSFGCFPTEDEARERLRQVEAAKAARNAIDALFNSEAIEPKEYGFDLRDVEIFRAGEWNGDKYTTEDLDDIVEAFQGVGFEPPLKLGHEEKSGDRAFGWVAALRRVGDRLVADFRDIPEQVFNIIKERGFDTVSSEIFWNLKRNGQTFRRALKAVALLGAEIPAVAGLKPLRASLTELSESECEVLKAYDISTRDISMSDVKKPANKADGGDNEAKIAELTAQLGQLQKEKSALEEKAQEKEGSALKLAEFKASMEEQSEAIKTLTKQLEESRERERQQVKEHKVNECRVPVLRPHLETLYSFALQTDKTAKFSVKIDGKEETQDATMSDVLDSLVSVLNKSSAKLFEQLGTAGDLHRDDEPADEIDPSEELDRLAKAYCQEKGLDPQKDYDKAFSAVRNDPKNADLVARYARG